MPGEGDFLARVVDVDPDLAVDDHIQLGADITFAEDRFALDVVSRDHQPVDAGQLLERERAEQGHLLQGDELFHVFIESVGCRRRCLADPPVGMSREGFELRMGRRPRQHRIEGLRFEQPRQRAGEPAGAEV